MSDFVRQNIFVPAVHFELIPIKNLVSNQNYQRPISNAHVGRTAQEFDIYQINPVKVSRRDNINYVFDGQHTIETIASASGSRDTPVWCMIYDDLDYEKEADIFANQKKHTRPLKAIEIFTANIEAENEKQIIIKKMVESYNLVISPKKVPGSVCAVNALEYVFDKYGYQALDRTLFLLVSTWEGEVDSLSSNMIKGTAKLVVAYGEKLNDEQFIDRLSKISVREVIRTAKDRHVGTQGYAEAMLIQYNKRLKYPLRFSDISKQQEGIAHTESVPDSEDEFDEMSMDAEEVVEDYEFEDDEEIPDVPGALPSQEFLDNLMLRNSVK